MYIYLDLLLVCDCCLTVLKLAVLGSGLDYVPDVAFAASAPQPVLVNGARACLDVGYYKRMGYGLVGCWFHGFASDSGGNCGARLPRTITSQVA
jgi:hypothetical protein